MSEDEKREGGANEGGQGSEAPKVPAPPKLTLDPEEKKAEDSATAGAAASTPTSTSTSTGGEAERESRRKRRKPAAEGGASEKAAPEKAAPEKVEAQLVAADLPARSRVIAASDAIEPKPDSAAERMDLPKWNRARVKRKQVAGEEEDAFQAGVRKAGRSAVQRAPLVIGLILVVAAGIAGVAWWRGHQAEKEAEATRLLASAAAVQARAEVKPEGWVNDRKLPFPIPLLDEEAERAQQVDKGLGELHAAAEGTDADRTADLMRAAQQYKDGKFTDALASYTQFLESNPKHELAFLAHEGKAMALEATGDIDGALAALDTLAGQKGDFYRDQALYQKARILEAADRKDDAIAIYEQYVEEYPLDQDSLAKPQVIERLRELKPELVPAETEAPGAGGFGLPPGLLQ